MVIGGSTYTESTVYSGSRPYLNQILWILEGSNYTESTVSVDNGGSSCANWLHYLTPSLLAQYAQIREVMLYLNSEL